MDLRAGAGAVEIKIADAERLARLLEMPRDCASRRRR